MTLTRPTTARPTTAALTPARQAALWALPLVLYVAGTIGALWNGWAVDFSALWFAGHFMAEGLPAEVYAAPPHVIGPEIPASWQAALERTGAGDEQTFPFIYPPWVAVASVPLTWLSPQAAMNLAHVLNTAMMAGSVWLAWRIAGRGRVPLWIWMPAGLALAATTTVQTSALALGQAQVLVYFLVLLAFERYGAGCAALAGAILAVAACLKVSPVLFGLVFLIDGNRRALVAFVATGLALTLGSVAALGWEIHALYLDRLRAISGTIYLSFFAWSVETWLFEVTGLIEGWAPPREPTGLLHGEKPAWIATTAQILLATALAGIWAVARRVDPADRAAYALTAMAFAVPLFMPLGWGHYYILGLVLLPGVVAVLPPRVTVLMVLGVGLATSVPLNTALFSQTGRAFPQILLVVPVMLAVTVALIAAPLAHGLRSRPAGVQPAE